MKHVFHLSNCGTCQKIIKENHLEERGFDFQDIKLQPPSPAQVDAMKELAGSYEALFSRRALKYKSMGLKDMKLTEKDYRRYILEEYTFLKRPVLVDGKKIFVGSEKMNLEMLKKHLGGGF